MPYPHNRPLPSFLLLTAGLLAALGGLSAPAPVMAQGVIDEWAHVQVPPPPPLVKVTLDAKTTALLVLDLATQTCNQAQRPMVPFSTRRPVRPSAAMTWWCRSTEWQRKRPMPNNM